MRLTQMRSFAPRRRILLRAAQAGPDNRRDEMIAVETLLANATAATGLDDFGDPCFRDGLERIVDASNSEARLSEAGEGRWAGSLTAYLANRLKIVDHLKHHPELIEAPIEKPMFVFGLPRTGTTLTINLLAADPARRSYLRWEALNSAPPAAAGALRSDPRYLAEQERVTMALKYMPQISAIHHEDADSPSECQYNMAMSFCAQIFDSVLDVPSYSRWFLDEADYRPTFRFHKQVLQLLQAENKGRWTLKNPWHPLFLDALTDVYPDAQLVMTHRDPVAVVGSACSLVRTVRPIYSDSVDLPAIAAVLMDTFDRMIARSDAFRAKHGANAIHDIQYAEQMRDPIGTMKALYARFDEPFTPSAEAGMRAHLANNPQGKHGKHHYTLEEFGLTAGAVRERYADYCARYDIPAEKKG
jgi:hypothetical protein